MNVGIFLLELDGISGSVLVIFQRSTVCHVHLNIVLSDDGWQKKNFWSLCKAVELISESYLHLNEGFFSLTLNRMVFALLLFVFSLGK